MEHPSKSYRIYQESIIKSTRQYETEILKLKKKIKELEAQTTPKWAEPVWEQIAHELVWAIGLLEEEPTSPKQWRRVFNVLKTYENAVRTNHE